MTQNETRIQIQTKIESEYSPGYLSRYSDLIGAERYGERSPKIFAPVQTGIGAQTSSCTICTRSLLKLIIFVGYHDIPVFIIKCSSMILVRVRKHIQSCRFLTPNLLLSTITVTTPVQCLSLYQVSVVIPEHYERFQASAVV
jgi:hypothetical protein